MFYCYHRNTIGGIWGESYEPCVQTQILQQNTEHTATGAHKGAKGSDKERARAKKRSRKRDIKIQLQWI